MPTDIGERLVKLELSFRAANLTRQAITAGPGAVSAWERLSAAVVEYDEIRTTQRRLYKDAVDGWTESSHALLSVAFLTNALDYEATWTSERSTQAQRVDTYNYPVTASLKSWMLDYPKPEYAPAKGNWWPTIDRGAYLLATAAHANFWVPTNTKLELAFKAAKRATRAPAYNG